MVHRMPCGPPAWEGVRRRRRHELCRRDGSVQSPAARGFRDNLETNLISLDLGVGRSSWSLALRERAPSFAPCQTSGPHPAKNTGQSMRTRMDDTTRWAEYKWIRTCTYVSGWHARCTGRLESQLLLGAGLTDRTLAWQHYHAKKHLSLQWRQPEAPPSEALQVRLTQCRWANKHETDRSWVRGCEQGGEPDRDAFSKARAQEVALS